MYLGAKAPAPRIINDFYAALMGPPRLYNRGFTHGADTVDPNLGVTRMADFLCICLGLGAFTLMAAFAALCDLI